MLYTSLLWPGVVTKGAIREDMRCKTKSISALILHQICAGFIIRMEFMLEDSQESDKMVASGHATIAPHLDMGGKK